MVFVDTSAIYAVLDRDDEFHGAAHEVWSRLLSGDDELVTSNYIVLEAFALIQSRLGMEALRSFNDEVLPVLRTEWVTPADHLAGTQAVLAANRRNLSLVDCTSFALMRRLRLRSAFVFDAHFEEQGFRVMPG
jgi:predicted nucleic acid-binding protein